MTRPTWQRRSSQPPAMIRASRAAADMHTALAMLARGAVATEEAPGWVRLSVPGTGSTAKLPAGIVAIALAEIAAGDVVASMFREGEVA